MRKRLTPDVHAEDHVQGANTARVTLVMCSMGSGVTGTPIFFLNGVLYSGDDSCEAILEAIETETHFKS